MGRGWMRKLVRGRDTLVATKRGKPSVCSGSNKAIVYGPKSNRTMVEITPVAESINVVYAVSELATGLYRRQRDKHTT